MRIQAPNGDTIEFPDGTPDSVILDVMRREYGGPASGAPPAPSGMVGGKAGASDLPPAPPGGVGGASSTVVPPPPQPGGGMPSIPGIGMPSYTQTPTGEYVEAPAPAPTQPPTPAPPQVQGAGMPGIPGFRPMATTTTPAGEYQVRQTPELMASSPRHSGRSDVAAALADVAQSAASGFRQGVVSIPGLPGDLESLGRSGINWAARMASGRDAVSPDAALPTSADYRELDQGVTPRAKAWQTAHGGVGSGPYYEPETRAGRYARSIGQFAHGAALPGSAVARALLNTTVPAVASEAAGEATEGTRWETPSRIAAALLAPFAPRAAMRAITPLPAAAGRIQQAGVLANEGVELTAGQVTGSRPLRWAESSARDMPFAGGPIGAITERQGEQLTRALLRRVGETGADALATPQVLAAARARIGAEFDRVTQHPLPLNTQTSQQIATRLGDAFRQYLEQVPSAAHRPFVEGFMHDMLNAMTTPGGRLRASISGERVQHFRSRLSTAARETADPEYAAFLRAARETLDDIYGATLPANEAAAWATARQHWRHLLVLEDAVAGSAMGTPYGTASPASLRRASRAGDPQAFAEGRGTYTDLATAAGTLMDALPNSGTPARLSVGWGIPGAIAGGIGDLLSGTPGSGTMSGAAATGILGPMAQARIISSPRMQQYLGNQRLAGPLNAGAGRSAGAVARALMLPAEMGGN
jgi:hypothetical protein